MKDITGIVNRPTMNMRLIMTTTIPLPTHIPITLPTIRLTRIMGIADRITVITETPTGITDMLLPTMVATYAVLTGLGISIATRHGHAVIEE